MILTALVDRAPPTLTGLADICGAQQPTMTRVVEQLVQTGHVSRKPDPQDRRVVRVTLTKEGNKLAKLLVEDYAKAIEDDERKQAERTAAHNRARAAA